MDACVFLGVGHGGLDPGAVKYVREADANLTMALEARRILESYGITVGMSRTVDENDTIYEEIREANEFFARFPIHRKAAIEFHNNAGRGDGFEAYIQTNQYAAESRALAEAIEAEVKAIGQNSRGLKTRVFGWVTDVNAPSVLTEGFFVDNWNDAKDFDTAEEQKKLADAYARGILKYFGIDPDAKPEPEQEAVPYSITASGTVSAPTKAFADEVADEIRGLGFSALVKEVGSIEQEPVAREIEPKSIVRVKPGAKYYDNGDVPKDFVFNRDHVVHSISGDRVVITYGGVVVGAIHKDDLILV